MLLADAGAPLTWNVGHDVAQLFEFHFMVNAFRAGTAVAVAAAAVGWFMVLRRQTFAGHTLSVVGFPGAAGAIWLGFSASVGFYAFCVTAAVVIATLPRTTGSGYSEESAVIGTIQAFTLAAGFLFVSLYGGFLNGLTALLFGSVLGITDAQVVTLGAVAIVALVVLALVGRPLVFASVDPDGATARGVRARLLSTLFLVVLGVAVAAASQITGALLVFTLLVVPAATAQVITARPGLSITLAIGLGVGIIWAGLAASYYSPYPVGFWTTTIAFSVYVAARDGDPARAASRIGVDVSAFLLAAAGTGVSELFAHAFMRNALLGGTAIAAASGLVGYFVVLRSQVFSTDALSHVAFTGAFAALAAGLDPRIGLFAATIMVAVLIGTLGERGRANNVVIGTVFTWILGLGVLFLALYTTSSSAGNGTANVTVLFGSIFGLQFRQALLAAVIGVAICVAIVGIARPLLFASIDETVAAARGVRVRALGIVFLGIVGVCAAEATQAVGALLLVGLIAAPAGAAHRLTTRPWFGLTLAAGLAIASMWLGLFLSYVDGSIPPSFSIMAVAAGCYAVTFVPRVARAYR